MALLFRINTTSSWSASTWFITALKFVASSATVRVFMRQHYQIGSDSTRNSREFSPGRSLCPPSSRTTNPNTLERQSCRSVLLAPIRGHKSKACPQSRLEKLPWRKMYGVQSAHVQPAYELFGRIEHLLRDLNKLPPFAVAAKSLGYSSECLRG